MRLSLGSQFGTRHLSCGKPVLCPRSRTKCTSQTMSHHSPSRILTERDGGTRQTRHRGTEQKTKATKGQFLERFKKRYTQHGECSDYLHTTTHAQSNPPRHKRNNKCKKPTNPKQHAHNRSSPHQPNHPPITLLKSTPLRIN